MSAYDVLLWLHVLVMGYWIGSDLVVNALTHYVTHAASLPGPERRRLWEFLMDVDQHPRNALILSVPIGFTLAAQSGLLWLDDASLAALWFGSAAWFACMQLARHGRSGVVRSACTKWDARVRYALIAALLFVGAGSLLTGRPLAAPWLAWKVLLFAGVIGCGLAIRRRIREADEAWTGIWAGSPRSGDEDTVRRAMRRATIVLWVLWGLLAAIGWLGVAKPEFGQSP